MQKSKDQEINMPQQAQIRIGNTTYEISVYFSQSSTERARDKLKRIIINDCLNGQNSVK